MKKLMVMTVLLCAVSAPVASASHVIDGSLADWGVTPFSNWVPNWPADYTQTDNVNLYNATGYGEYYDFEAMYFDDDPGNFYLAVVSSYPMGGPDGGDVGLDLNGDMTIGPHGSVGGLEYALKASSGQLLSNPTWSDTYYHYWPDGWQGTPLQASGGTVLGNVPLAIQYDAGMEFGTFVLEASIPRSLLGGGGGIGDFVGIHMAQWCGNDSINLVGTVATVPAPGALLLTGIGMGLVGWLRRRRAV